jgi:uncharacterized protein (TIGR02284 family)
MTNNNLKRATQPAVPELAGEDRPGDISTLEHLLKVSVDAADNAHRLAELLKLDADIEGAKIFRDISAERRDFARRLAVMLVDRGQEGPIDAHGTFRGVLFRWRLQLAKHLPMGYRDTDDRRFLLRLARRGSDLVATAYAHAERRPLGPTCRQEVQRQAKAVRATNHMVHQLAADA